MKTIKGMFTSIDMRIINANKNKLSSGARQVYLQGFARLSKAEEVAMKGNAGRGFRTQFLFSEPRKAKETR